MSAGKHAAPAVSAVTAIAAAAVVPVALSGTVVPAVPAVHMSPAVLDAEVVHQMPQPRPLVTRIISVSARKAYTVVSGDTLSGIAGRFCRNAGKWPSLWRGNRAKIVNPDRIFPGQRLRMTCRALALTVAQADPPAGPPALDRDGDHDHDNGDGVPAPRAAAVVTGASGVVGTAGMSAFERCVIQRESGGNARAVNPTSGAGGLFQFLPSTWASLGFSGLPENASVATQEAAFAKAYALDGVSPWRPYDGC